MDWIRASVVLALALLLQGSSCRVDPDDDDDGQGGTRNEVILLPPRFDPWGRPQSGPIPLELRVPAERARE